MPLYIPWLTETIKKRGVRYLLHHYLGQFFEEKLTLEQLSIDIYEGKGSIKDLALDVDGLNDELDFIPFRFLDGCSIGQISVEVPWSSLSTEACRVELEDAKFVCRLKTSADGSKTHCTESTLLSRSLMTSSMQMAEEIVTTEDDDDCDSPNSSTYRPQQGQDSKRKAANQMFEGLEMFAQLIDSVLRRTKLTARNTLFQIRPHPDDSKKDDEDETDNDPSDTSLSSSTDSKPTIGNGLDASSDNCNDDNYSSEGTVEFLIRFFRCEEIIDQTKSIDSNSNSKPSEDESNKQSQSAIPETVTKLLTLEDVEMRIGGIPVSNLVGKHTIMIKFNGHKSEISIFSGSPLLAVIGHLQLKTFFNVFDNPKDCDGEASPTGEKNQKVLSAEDYAKIESQLLESASLRTAHETHMNELGFAGSSQVNSQSGRRWLETGNLYSSSNRNNLESNVDYHSPNSSSSATCLDGKVQEVEPSLDNIEAFSCELKLPGIWLCILKDGEKLPPLIKPYADSINSFQTINKYIDEHIKVPHIRLLALKVALDITSAGISVFLGDLDISERLQDDSLKPNLHLLRNDTPNFSMNSSGYKATVKDNREITIDLLTQTRLLVDPTMIDRIVYDYKLINPDERTKSKITKRDVAQRNNQMDLNITLRGDQFKVELLCPIPDLRPEAYDNITQLRPQSFLFDFKDIILSWHVDKLNVSSKELLAYVKTQPQQTDLEAIKFIEATCKNNERILLTLEPSPSNLETAFPNEIERALNESSLYDSIYVGQTTESSIPTEAFQLKRKVVRDSLQNESAQRQESVKINECDYEKIITPGDRQHLMDYLNQTVSSTKLSLTLHLPLCEVEFEDKEQLDLIYNRFGNDFIFWAPKAFSSCAKNGCSRYQDDKSRHTRKSSINHSKPSYYEQPSSNPSSFEESSDLESEVSFHSLSHEGSNSDLYENEVTCKITVDELFVRFNHQSCAAAMKQEIAAENLLLGVVVDVNNKPNTVLSFVADNLELSTDSDVVLEGNTFGNKNSSFSLTAEIKRPTRALKDIKLAIQLVNGLFNDFKADTYTRFWQSINVTDEAILGYVGPTIVTELHINILSTALSLVRQGARPALVCIDELYLTSMVMEQTSQVMFRLIADEVSLYLKKNKQNLESMKNYVCLIDSGLIDVDVKFSTDGRLEFNVINNVITVRACQDSLSALCKLFNVMVKNLASKQEAAPAAPDVAATSTSPTTKDSTQLDRDETVDSGSVSSRSVDGDNLKQVNESDPHSREMDLLEDAMNDFSEEDQDSSEEDSDGQEMGRAADRRNPHACILDESNPLIGDLFSQPLLPSPGNRIENSMESLGSTRKAIDESGFFVIGDDDVGAGIIDKTREEPIVRKLIDGPINIIDNHFKMTRPRTLPEMLANSFERYVLEEMTLVVNLYGGRDLEDDSSEMQTETEVASSTTNEEALTDAGELLDSNSQESGSIRSRRGSLASSIKRSSINRKHCSSESASSLKKKSSRRKHLSEGSRDIYGKTGTNLEPRVRFGEGAVNLWESLDLISAPNLLSSKRSNQPISSESKTSGGTWRKNDVCIQLTLSKVKLLYEVAEPNSPISWRFILFIHDIEIKDRIHASDINKLLYEYCTESMPKRNTQILTIKNTATINPSDGCEECDLRASLKPLRLNIDQDTLLFLIEFFTGLGKSLTKQQSVYGQTQTNVAEKTEGLSKGSGSGQDQPVRGSVQQRSRGANGQNSADAIDIRRRQRKSSSEDASSLSFGSTTSSNASSSAYQAACEPQLLSTPSSATDLVSTATTTTTNMNEPSALPTHCHKDSSAQSAGQQPIYIKCFTFSPDVPIRLDYHAKHLDFEQGALAGILMGLAHLDHSELVLRRVQAKHGMRGLDRALLFALNSWLSDIKRNQLPSILSGVGPMHSVVQLFQGLRDLVWMPIDHYRKDRRLVRGLQRGASSFSSSTAMAAINLVNRFISIVQCTAQIAHDIVTPPQARTLRRDTYKSGLVTGGSTRSGRSADNASGHSGGGAGASSNSLATLNQPRNFCEGVAVGFTILKEGFNDTARNVAVGMQAEDVRSAVGELVRQIPSTLLNPIISATEGAQNVLVGIRNQIAPDARRDDQEKWKRRVRGK